MHDHDVGYRDTKLIRDNLGKRCFLALSMWRRPGVDHHGATVLDTHASALIETNRRAPLGADAAGLDIGGEANAHQLTLCASLSLFGTQVLITCNRQCFVQGALVVAPVIHSHGTRLVRELLRLDEVEPAYLSRVLAQFTRHQVNGR